jgi:hypothetical protein
MLDRAQAVSGPKEALGLLFHFCDAGQLGEADTINSLDLAADFFAEPFRILSGFVFQFHFEE